MPQSETVQVAASNAMEIKSIANTPAKTARPKKAMNALLLLSGELSVTSYNPNAGSQHANTPVTAPAT
ncbi:MAG: hypothetical protein AAF197_07265 [Pseudomonadota bacterium]